VKWLSALLALGCAGPIVVWHGRSPDRTRRAQIIEDELGQHAVIDGAADPPFSAIGVTHARWLGGSLIYPARTADGWHLVQNGALGPAYEAIGDITIHRDRLAYCVQDREGWRVIAGGERGPAFRSLRAGSLQFAGDRVVYIARDDRGERVMIDGVEGPIADRVEDVSFGDKDRFIAYIARRADGERIVAEDRESPPFDDVLELRTAQDAPRWAAIVRASDGTKVLHDGAQIGADGELHDVRISPRGDHVAWIDGASDVYLDGARVGSHRAVERIRVAASGLLYVGRDEDGAHVIHRGVVGPAVRVVDAVESNDAGHWGYVAQLGIGRVVVIDGVVRFRGEWAGALTLAAESDRWAFVAREAGERFVVTPEGRFAVDRPFVDTLTIDARGHWAIVTGALEIVADGSRVASIDPDEISAALTQGRDGIEVVREIVRAELARIGDQ
jgi:hypothetical protein